MRKTLFGVLLGALCLTVSPALAEVTYTFTGNFQNGNFVPPNATFSVTVPDFITSDTTFTAAQSDLSCGDNFVQCTGVSFLTDFSSDQDAIAINFISGNTPESAYYYFAPDAFGTLGSFSQDAGSFFSNGTLVTAVPEPSTWAMMILASSELASWRIDGSRSQ
jgi:hypothetical protein